MGRRGRPTKLTEQTAARLVGAARRGLPTKQMLAIAKISASTFAAWRKKADEGNNDARQLFEDIEAARAAHAFDCMQVLNSPDASPTKVRAASWMLQHLHGVTFAGDGIAPPTSRPELQLSQRGRKQTRADLLREELEAARAAVDAATAGESWQAVVNGRRQVLAIHAELVALEAAERDAADDDLTPEELEAEVVEVLRGMPRDLAQRLMDEAHPPPGLRVVQGGEA